MAGHEDFLQADFGQAQEWMRHYDSSFTSVTNFYYAGFVAILTAAYFLCSTFRGSKIASMGASLLLLFGALLTPLFLYLLMKNRVYFTKVARWVNEVRCIYLKQKPLGIQNETRMYTNYKMPLYFAPTSTHSMFLYFTALCGSALASLTYLGIARTVTLEAKGSFMYSVTWLLVVGGVVFIGYVLWIVFYLRSCEARYGTA